MSAPLGQGPSHARTEGMLGWYRPETERLAQGRSPAAKALREGGRVIPLT